MNPFRCGWTDEVLRPLAERSASGEDDRDLRDELFGGLWRWATSLADLEVRRLPPGADRDETRSRVLVAVWRSVEQLDWDRWEEWPGLLLRRVRGARMDAARCDDRLSRGDRAEVNRLRIEQDHLEILRGRTLTGSELDDLVESVWVGVPVWRRAALAQVAAGAPAQVDELADELVDERWRPERQAEAEDDADRLRHWLQHDVPPHLQVRLARWAQHGRTGSTVPLRLRKQLSPYLASLSRQVADGDGSPRGAVKPA
jgi:hypothetical protein